MLLAFDDEIAFARRVARAAGLPVGRIRRHRFPDGELKLTLPARLPRRVALLRSLHGPNEKLVEVLLAACGARDLGARHVTLVAPYLAYMRQDAAFRVGEVVSQRHVGDFLASVVDRVITVDPHLHRVHGLDEVLPDTTATTLTAAPTIGAFLRRRARRALVVGPDEESAQWVRLAAGAAGLPWTVARKVRRGDRQVSIALPDVDFHGRHVVLVDDLISTGRTLAGAARALLVAGATRVDVAATHALFVPNAEAAMRSAGIAAIWTTDTVPHATNAVPTAALVGEALAARRPGRRHAVAHAST
ncbi:MAG: ribose-phosphate diphosphokinase [Vicinamibacterales bacterium]